MQRRYRRGTAGRGRGGRTRRAVGRFRSKYGSRNKRRVSRRRTSRSPLRKIGYRM